MVSGLKKLFIFSAVLVISQTFEMLTPKNSPLLGGVNVLSSDHSQINSHMRAKFGRDPTVVSEERGRGIDRQTHKGTLQLYINP